MGILSKKWNFIDRKMSGLRVCPANQINNIDFPRAMRDRVEIRNPVEGTNIVISIKKMGKQFDIGQ